VHASILRFNLISLIFIDIETKSSGFLRLYLYSCKDGYGGQLCDVKVASSTQSGAAVPVVLTLLALAVVLGIVFWYFRHKRALLPLAWWNKKRGLVCFSSRIEIDKRITIIKTINISQ